MRISFNYYTLLIKMFKMMANSLKMTFQAKLIAMKTFKKGLDLCIDRNLRK